MTEIVTGQIDHGSDRPQPALGTLEHLDPHTLQIGTTCATTPPWTRRFSTASPGMASWCLSPPSAPTKGVVTVRNGQRRTLAAREVGLISIPAYVLPASVAGESTEVVERIVHPIITNDQKPDLTDTQPPAVDHVQRRSARCA